MNKCKICKEKFEYGEYALKQEKETGICHDCLNRPFEITSICRLDLLDRFTPKEIARLKDWNMERLASKMADAYCEQDFWQDLEIIGEYILKDK